MPSLAWGEIIGTFIVMALVALGVHHYDAAIYGQEQEKAVSAQAASDTSECNAAKAITKGANDDLQKDLDAAHQHLIELERVHPAASVRVPAASRAVMANAGQARRAGQNGAITTNDFRAYAADYKSCQVTLGICEKFVHDERTTIGKRP